MYSVAYAYGPVTVTVSNNEYDDGTASSDQETSSYAISYTVTDDLSLTYGQDTIEKESDADDAEYSVIKAAYTSGGMTITATMKDAENIAHTTGTDEDIEYWSLGASFAF